MMLLRHAPPPRRLLGTLTHLTKEGSHNEALPAMVRVASKPVTTRTATAEALLVVPPSVWSTLSGPGNSSNRVPVFSTAIAAGVLGAKQTSSLIPMCHSLPLEGCDINIELLNDDAEAADGKQSPAAGSSSKRHVIKVTCTATVSGKTGVEMEALTGASVACLTLYDMLKGAAKGSAVAAADNGAFFGSAAAQQLSNNSALNESDPGRPAAAAGATSNAGVVNDRTSNPAEAHTATVTTTAGVGMAIEGVRLVRKSGGHSGDWVAPLLT